MNRRTITYLWLLCLLLACQKEEPRELAPLPLPTQQLVAPTLTATNIPVQLPATYTPNANQIAQNATLPPLDTRAPQPTGTRWDTRTPIPLPTNTPRPANVPNAQPPAPNTQSPPEPTTTTRWNPTNTPWSPPASPTVRWNPTNTPWSPPPASPTSRPSSPASGTNLLPNGSFENGHYNLNGIPELQLPNQWLFEWEEGNNPLDPDPWNSWLRPETRVLSRDFLPANEHATFIWDGNHTVKIFKEHGAINFKLQTTLFLQPGRYQLQISLFPDLVVGYTDSGQKIWAPDPLSGEVRLLANATPSAWHLPAFGRKNSYLHDFTVSQPQNVTIGAHIRGRWGLANNGWFLDDWRLIPLP